MLHPLTWTKPRRLRRLLQLGAALIVVGAIFCALQPRPSFALMERLAPNIVWRVDTEQRLVALSFDDGPHPVYTAQVLDILAAQHAHATFCLIGERAARHPDLVQRIRGAGHEVGNHYFMSGTILAHSDDDFVGYIDRTEKAGGITGPTKLFRPPSGLAWPGQLRLAQRRGYTCVLGSAYPYDASRPPAWYIQWLVEKNLAPGSIVILHDGIADPTRTIAALPHILAAGHAKGLRFVSVGELIGAGRQPRSGSSS
jgi:peptidoglycan-N-acetylglucosamine deacetylase